MQVPAPAEAHGAAPVPAQPTPISSWRTAENRSEEITHIARPLPQRNKSATRSSVADNDAP
jgi:hypothetical protein